MRNTDPSFRASHTTIDAELYQRKWSYNDLPDHNLYCDGFTEVAEIPVETLVETRSARIW